MTTFWSIYDPIFTSREDKRLFMSVRSKVWDNHSILQPHFRKRKHILLIEIRFLCFFPFLLSMHRNGSISTSGTKCDTTVFLSGIVFVKFWQFGNILGHFGSFLLCIVCNVHVQKLLFVSFQLKLCRHHSIPRAWFPIRELFILAIWRHFSISGLLDLLT